MTPYITTTKHKRVRVSSTCRPSRPHGSPAMSDRHGQAPEAPSVEGGGVAWTSWAPESTCHTKLPNALNAVLASQFCLSCRCAWPSLWYAGSKFL
eukprot:1157976-Pelagomonas_calceolata.AAC.3